ncbi:sugar fermentation stimulation protein [Synechococcus sp. PCC 7502]|uniref:DNA/RNA nuclease SfsA n=1 Tax=Synechococcus sp. PCC 7502 TaxID=1173263 RepID=UPI00029FC91F|nr:DNA/RNA nuclease SfsA [Synechococcus sp. PCC 7502]AFY74577.1 sugar fermentation stimulation protein [Synechococcus sp. PCC 7502]
MIVHTYPPLIGGTLVKRYKRFFADIELSNGEIVTAHCANTGPMTGICTIGSSVYLSQSSDPKRKLKYTWEIIDVNGIWVGVNTSLPNKIIGSMLDRHLLPELEPYDSFKPEVAYGSEKSRIDFLLTHAHNDSNQDSKKLTTTYTKTYLEVKNTTWHDGNIALFPDTVTTRGQKHLRELMGVIAQNTKSAIVYFINRSDCDDFRAGKQADPEYAQLLDEAMIAGVKVLPYRFHITPQSVEFLGIVKF